MFCEIELTKSSVMGAMKAADKIYELQRLSSLAKTMAGKPSFGFNEAVQMHGGIGVTDEYDIGFFLKKLGLLNKYWKFKFHTESMLI